MKAARPEWGWFRDHLVTEILPRWLRQSVTPSGAFLPHLDRSWNPLPDQCLTLVSQSRLLYNFAQGYALTGDPAYRDAVEHGGRFLGQALRDRRHGGWFWSCSPAGEVQDARKDTYGHAFVLFGMAHAYRCTGNREFLDAARHTWEILDTRLRDGHSGFIMRADSDFGCPSAERSANPLMHLLEALLAAGDVPGQEAFYQDAARLVEFVLRRIRPGDGLLPERYSSQWAELPEAEGGYLDLGHHFEWAYLLSAAVERGLPDSYLGSATRLLDGGMRLGFDPSEGGIYSAASPAGVTRVEGKNWWQQCEAIRALLHHAVVRGRDDLWEPLTRTVAFVRARFVDPEQGGWYQSLHRDGTPAHRDKGNEWKVDYHVVGMCTEALRLAGAATP